MNLLTRLILENYKKKYNSDSKIVVSNVEVDNCMGYFKNVVRQHNAYCNK